MSDSTDINDPHKTHGIPPGVESHEPTGTPTSDRHATETGPIRQDHTKTDNPGGQS